MKEMPDALRLDATAKQRLMTLKRRTGIGTWNVLCRWAFCLSLSIPLPDHQASRSDFDPPELEIPWHIFAGRFDFAYQALLYDECIRRDVSLEKKFLGAMLREHVERGLGYLISKSTGSGPQILAELTTTTSHDARGQLQELN